MRSRILLLVAVAALVTTASVSAAVRPLTNGQYQAMLTKANAQVTRVDDALQHGLKEKAGHARMKALLLSYAATQRKLGQGYQAVRPPANALAELRKAGYKVGL